MLVTIFGGGGFLGRYVAQELLAKGARVRVAEREPGHAVRVKPLGGLGQVQLVHADVRDADSVRRAVVGSEVVVNLVGILRGDFDAIHRQGAAHVAQAAAAGARALVHVSAIGADAASASAYGRSKGQGEEAVRSAFPQVTVIRPSVLFGREDQFTNRFADLIRSLPILPVIGGGTRFQPAYVVDVAKAIAVAACDPKAHGGKIYELGGPQQMTMTEINRFIATAIGDDPAMFEIPDVLSELIARVAGWLPGAPITLDQWRMLQHDNVVAPKARGFAELGISTTPMAAVADSWLVRYRKHGRFTARAKV